MPALPLPLGGLALLAAVLIGAGLGFQWRDKEARAVLSDLQAHQSLALAEAQQQARQREQQLTLQIEAVSHDAEKQLQAVAAAERAAADTRLREQAARFAAGRTRANPATTPGCEAERTRAAVLAKLLADADELAQGFATEADRNRLAGKACESAYEAARNVRK